VAQRVTAVFALMVCATAGCGTSQPAVPVLTPALALPTAGLAGQSVAVYPLTLLAADQELEWQEALTPRRAALQRADSIIAAMLVERSPEVNWVLPEELRRAASRAPGMLANPDQMGTALLRSPQINQIPDPLRSQMRTLNGFAGGRFALVPASLIYAVGPEGGARAELTLVLADVRTGAVGWRTVAHAEGADPWASLRDAFKTLVPGLP
jgi:hypothetical protein